MPQFDRAHEWTDEQIEDISKRIKSEYSHAREELDKRLEEWPEEFERKRERLQAMLDAKEISQQEYRRRIAGLQAHEKWLSDMVQAASVGTTSVTERAVTIVNDEIPNVTAYSMNYSTYAIEREARLDTMFTLVDGDTVNRLFEGERQLLPFVEVDKEKAVKWNAQHFQSALTQGLLQGESIPEIAKRMQSVIAMTEKQSVRAARTACTGAENAGRTRAYQRANDMGIEVLSEWRATLDTRTRMSHRALNGQRVRPGEKFSNGCTEPGDPNGPGEEVWNCRCALVPYVVGANYGKSDGQWFRDEKIEDMTYDEWVAGKDIGIKTEQGHVIAEGEDILGTWERRPDQFDFAIEDVMDAQGFTGVPRIVSADEFDAAVKVANGGDGLMMQRVYSAPSREVLDGYREQLYSGEWYVDCSQGGSAYGRGMYTASDYSGRLSDGLTAEMAAYGSTREFAYVETMTLDRSAKIVDFREISDMRKAVERQMDPKSRILSERRAEALAGLPENQREDYGKFFDYLFHNYGTEYDFKEVMDAAQRIDTNKATEIGNSIIQQMVDAEKTDEYQQVMAVVRELDEGSIAALHGYDAIKVDGRGASGSYTVVLNRTKLIIRRPE